MIDDYPYEYPTNISSYTDFSELEDGKTSEAEYVYIAKPKKGKKIEFVVVKCIYIDPSQISSNGKEKFEKNVNFIFNIKNQIVGCPIKIKSSKYYQINIMVQRGNI